MCYQFILLWSSCSWLMIVFWLTYPCLNLFILLIIYIVVVVVMVWALLFVISWLVFCLYFMEFTLFLIIRKLIDLDDLPTYLWNLIQFVLICHHLFTLLFFWVLHLNLLLLFIHLFSRSWLDFIINHIFYLLFVISSFVLFCITSQPQQSQMVHYHH